MFLREIKGKNKTYLSLMEGYREEGKVKQRTIISFGAIDDLVEEDILGFATKLLSYCKSNTLVDIKNISECSITNWGASKIIDQLWKKFELDGFFNTILKKSKVKFNLQAVLKLMLIARLCCPESKYQTHKKRDYYERYNDIELYELYRSLDVLADNQEPLEKHVFEQNVKQFSTSVAVVFFDVTTFYFESIRSDELRDFGYGKDGKFNEVQIVFSLLVNQDGRPIGFNLFSGNTYEGNTLISAIGKLKEQYKIKKVIVVADRGINSADNLKNIKDAGFEYIVGSRIKSLSATLKTQILSLEEYATIQTSNEEEVFKYKVINYERAVKNESGEKQILKERLICTWSSTRATKDKQDRERLVIKAKNMIAKKKFEEKRGAKKYIQSEIKDQPQLNTNKIEADEKWDGFYGIETSDSILSPQEIAKAYHTLWLIESSFRTLKSHLEARPVFHWTPKRIIGHFVLSYIAFLFERTLELGLKDLAITFNSPNHIREAINSMESSRFEIGGKKIRVNARLGSVAKGILKFLDLPLRPSYEFV